MGVEWSLIFGTGCLPSPTRAGGPIRHNIASQMVLYNLEAPHSLKDQDIRLASATLALDDTLFPSEVLSGQLSGVPSLWRCQRRLPSSIFRVSICSGVMAGSIYEQPRCIHG